jgi:hypothetical protein
MAPPLLVDLWDSSRPVQERLYTSTCGGHKWTSSVVGSPVIENRDIRSGGRSPDLIGKGAQRLG